MRKTLPALLALAVSALANPALALDPLPKKEGFSGFVGVGATGGQVKSNFLAELMTVELSNRTIYNLGSPYGTNIVLPVFDYNLGYTFDNKKTRVSVRTTTEDMIDFSSNNVLALRHSVKLTFSIAKR